jgi:hypothetical protein
MADSWEQQKAAYRQSQADREELRRAQQRREERYERAVRERSAIDREVYELTENLDDELAALLGEDAHG